MGLVYVEVPARYKKQQRFTIDDWFPVRHPDKAGTTALDGSDCDMMIRIKLKYQANCKLVDLVTGKGHLHLQNEEMAQKSKREFGDTIKSVNKEIKDHKNVGFEHLDEVEQKIKARRRRQPFQRGLEGSLRTTSRSRTRSRDRDTQLSLLENNLSASKIVDLGVNTSRTSISAFSPRQVIAGRDVIPDDLFQSTSRTKYNDSKLNDKLMVEYKMSVEEITRLKERIKALEEGQMTVDNLQLSRNLQEDQDNFNKERVKALKDLSQAEDTLETQRNKLATDQAAFDKHKKEYNEMHIQKQKIQDDNLKELEAKKKELGKLEQTLTQKESVLNSIQTKLSDKEKEQAAREAKVADYEVELQVQKDNLIAERNLIANARAKLGDNWSELEKERRAFEIERREFEKGRDKREKEYDKDLVRRNRDLQDQIHFHQIKEDELKKQVEELTKLRANFDEKHMKTGEESVKLESETIQLWKDKNKLSNDIRRFMKDKSAIESDMKKREEMIAQMQAELKDEREELDELEEQLDIKEDDLDKREREYIKDREELTRMKRAFLQTMAKSQNSEHMSEELKRLSKEMGMDLAQIEAEEAKLKAKEAEIQAIKQKNEADMIKFREMAERRASKRTSSASANSMFGEDFMKRRVIIKNPDNEDEIQYETVEDFIEKYQQNMKELKEVNDQLTAARRELDLLKEEQSRQPTSPVPSLPGRRGKRDPQPPNLQSPQDEPAVEEAEVGPPKTDRAEGERRGSAVQREADRRGSMLQKEAERANSRVQELEAEISKLRLIVRQLEEARENEGYSRQEEPGSFENLEGRLREILISMQTEQTIVLENPGISDGLRRIQYLVFHFLHRLLDYLLKLGRLRHTDQQCLTSLLDVLQHTGGTPRDRGGLPNDSLLADRLNEAYETISKLERRNFYYVEILRSMKDTYEFFEFSNDDTILLQGIVVEPNGAIHPNTPSPYRADQ